MGKPHRRWTAAALAMSMLVAAGMHGVVGKPAYAEEAAQRDGRTQHHWVTLVTGDRVLLRLAGQEERVVSVRPAKGREGARFLRQSDDGDLLVVPADVAPKVASGLVDRRLFNVSTLLEFGYDDSRRGDVPLIVTYSDGAAARSAGSRLRGAGVRAGQALPSIAGEALAVPKGTAAAFWNVVGGGTGARSLAAGVTRVWLDGKATAVLDRSVPQIGAPAAWQAGHTGRGAKVAVLDTGVDATHPDLADAVVAARDFTGSESGATDKFGHGTHVAGIITGSGAVVGGKYKGVAPDATILNGKVLDDAGGGAESWIIAGMEWAVAQGADVVNMSLGSRSPSDGTDPISQAVNRLTRDSGALFVVAAGNTGPQASTIGSPAAADEALTVGAVDHADQLAEFSSRGPRRGDSAVKPEITAPGVDIVAPLADGAALAQRAPVVDGRYLRLSGTSMATPHVAGAAAILAAQHPQWTADRLKPALTSTATPRPDLTGYEQGAGRVDVARATTQPVTATVASVNLGVQRWPHTDDEPVRRAVTYRNDGAVPVTVAVAVAGRDPAGNPAPAGMFTVDSQRVTVPAGGTGTVTLVTDTAVPAPDGVYSAVVTATSDQIAVHTPVGVVREVESYDVTLRVIDRDGRPTSLYTAALDLIAAPATFRPYDPAGTVVARVPKGDYAVSATVETPTGATTSLVVEPTVSVAGDMTMVIDAREAKPAAVTVDERDARPASVAALFDRLTPSGGSFGGVYLPDFDGLYVRPSQSTAPPGDFIYHVWADFARPDGSGGFAGSPYLYHVFRKHDGRVPAELVEHMGNSEFATVHHRIAAAAPGQVLVKDYLVQVTAPTTLTTYYTPGQAWVPTLHTPLAGGQPGEFGYFLAMGLVTYPRAGEVSVERWNAGVFGPAVTWNSNSGFPWVARNDGTLVAVPKLYGDQAPDRFGSLRPGLVRLALYRDGQPIGESPHDIGRFAVPADSSRYRLTADATQALSPLSTRISVAWTFQSAANGSDQVVPLQAVRFAPRLDDHNRARAGRRFVFPVYVQRQPGASYGSLTALRVQVSYDDGHSWQPVRLAGTGLHRLAIVDHPAGNGFVSLKATAADSNGNTVEQTIIRAYALQG